MTLTTKANILDEVTITALSCKGIITCIQLDNNGLSYKVIYWLNGKQETAWLLSFEFAV